MANNIDIKISPQVNLPRIDKPASSSAVNLRYKAVEQNFKIDEAKQQIDAGKISEEKVKEYIRKNTDYLKDSSFDLSISFDKSINSIVVQIVDKSSGKTIRQIPTEEVIAITKNIALFIDQQS